MGIVIALGIIVILSVLYSYSLSSNASTPIPEGCDEVLASCKTCSDVACSHSQK